MVAVKVSLFPVVSSQSSRGLVSVSTEHVQPSLLVGDLTGALIPWH